MFILFKYPYIKYIRKQNISISLIHSLQILSIFTYQHAGRLSWNGNSHFLQFDEIFLCPTCHLIVHKSITCIIYSSLLFTCFGVRLPNARAIFAHLCADTSSSYTYAITANTNKRNIANHTGYSINKFSSLLCSSSVQSLLKLGGLLSVNCLPRTTVPTLGTLFH